MYNYSIMPLDTEHAEEICEDIRDQYRRGIASSALFMIKLVPEGDPPIDKASMACQKYDVFRDKLAETGDSCGILAQVTIGHGYPLDNMFPFQQYVALNTGEKLAVVCPYDEGFRSYIRGAMKTLASHNPDSIMVDDDFRLLNRMEMGCACPLHMTEFNRRAGTRLSREELLPILRDPSTMENRRLKKIFEQTQKDSLLGAAKAMREGIDEVNPGLQGSFCTCGNDPAGEIAGVLAGKGNPSILRVNNGCYTAPGGREFSDRMFRAAKQMTLLSNKADVYLAETDTCPQNRYSTSAQLLHAHFTGNILEGVSGAKHWITRLGTFEPNSGKVYRDKLAKYRGFYETLSGLAGKLDWVGCKIPLPREFGFNFTADPYHGICNGWGPCVLERMGLPLYFSAKEGGAIFLDDRYDFDFSDDEIRDMLTGTVFLSSGAAKSLIQRGFGDLLGVDVRDWDGVNISGEQLYVNGNCINGQVGARELIVTDPDTVVDSMAYHLRDGKYKDSLFPASTIFRNKLGGTAIVFCGTPNTVFSFRTAFSFLNESRKLQLVKMLKSSGNLPIYYPEDAEVYLKAAKMEDGSMFCAVFNLGLDILEELPFTTDLEFRSVEKLSPEGAWEPVSFKNEVAGYTVQTAANPLDPVMLRLRS